MSPFDIRQSEPVSYTHLDLAGREAILKVHAKKIKASDDVDLHTIARMASGASGAELANIINEAALRAVRSCLLYTSRCV